MIDNKTIVQRIYSRILDFIVSIRTSKMRERIPRPIRSLGYHFLPKLSLQQKMWQKEYRHTLDKAKPVPVKTSVRLGIIKDFMGRYANYEVACLELGVPYKLIDITGDLWIQEVQNSGCDAFLVWPSNLNRVTKQMFDERLYIIVKEMHKIVFPSYNALWLYESKRRTNDWLTVNNVPHPSTHVFFDKLQAKEFLRSATFPLVFKTDLGAAVAGVEIIKNKKLAYRLLDICFDKGYVRKRCVWKERNIGYILFQEYIPNAKEWRMIRIGKSFFGHQKLKKGEFHSASNLVGWYEPPRKLLNLSREITEKGSFLSMAIDIFETTDGKYLVNELQALFGSREPSQMYIDDKPGRFVYEMDSDSWRFEEGYFCQNGSCKLRVKVLLELLGKPLSN